MDAPFRTEQAAFQFTMRRYRFVTLGASTTTRLYFRMGLRGPLAPEKPYSVGVRGAAKPPLAPPLRMESGGLRPPDLPTLVVILDGVDCICYINRMDGRRTTEDECNRLPSPVVRRA